MEYCAVQTAGHRQWKGARIGPVVCAYLMPFWLWLAYFDPSCPGQTTSWYEGFEGPQVSWRPAGGNGRYQIELHQRIRGEARTGDGCERVTVLCADSSPVYFSHETGRARVIAELAPSVQVRSDRAGVQVFARVVLPRTSDPRTGRPLATLVAGSTYHQVGRWQQLRIEGIVQLLARQTRVLRAQLGPAVDPREAYVDAIVLNICGGPGRTNVWIDDLDVGGYMEAVPTGGAPNEPPFSSIAQRSTPSAASGPFEPSGGAAGEEARDRIRLSGSVLLVEGRPTFVRAIQYQGEPLARLRQLGFNTLWLSSLPSTDLVDQARQLGLWLICPPPRPPVATGVGPGEDAIAPIGPAYDRVLAWDLGSGLSADRFAATRQWAEQVRMADRLAARPLVCRPESELRGYSRVVDVLVIGRAPLASSLELADYGAWVRGRPRLARPGTPIWTTVQTQPAPALVQQWRMLSRGEPPPTTMASEQIRLGVYTAILAGSRGLLFESHSPLSDEDADTRQRAMTLELLNLELDLIEPWLAAGNFVAAVPGSEAEVVAGVLQSERARLAVPLWSAPGAQFVAGQSAGHGISLVIPGVPESNNAYLLAPGEVAPLRHKRVTGGTRVTLDEFGLSALVLLTQDPLIVTSLTRRAQASGARAAELERELVVAKFQEVQQVAPRLAGTSAAVDSSLSTWLGSARQELQSCDGALSQRQYPAAAQHAQRAARPLRIAQRNLWEAAVAGLRSPTASPAAVCFRTLPWHRELMGRVGAGSPGENRLALGDFEDLGAMLQAGWNHFQHPVSGVVGEANLAPGAAHSGRFGLRLSARANLPEEAQTLVESPPVWITSPPVPVEAGELMVIHGWIQIPSPLTGSVDGLLILDSVSGEALAERIGETVGWEEFTLYRLCPESGQMSLTFALSGLGEAWLDDVSIHAVR